MSPEEKSKEWADKFSKETLFSQICTLQNISITAISLELKLSVNKLLIERAQQYVEVLDKEGKKIEQELEIVQNMKALICALPNENKTLLCGLPKNHTLNPLTTRHQNGNVFW